MAKSFKLLRPRFSYPVGTVVYDCILCDYGCSGDDMRVTGEEHRAMTTDQNGGYPFFTVPVSDLEEIICT